MENNKKIIYIISNPPPYHLYEGEKRSEISWDISDNSWVGIYPNEWGHLIGEAIVGITDKYVFEIWQPDYRADKVYSHHFSTGVLCKLFPAIKYLQNGRAMAWSEKLMTDLLKEHNCIVHGGINSALLWKMIPSIKKFPIVATSHGSGFLPINQIFKMRKNLRNYYYTIKNHVLLKKVIREVDAITVQSDDTQKTLTQSYYIAKEKITHITMGVDFNHFKLIERNEARKQLEFDLSDNILLTVCRLNPRKQIDKLIDILCDEVYRKFPFKLVVVGSGEQNYVNYLQKIAQPLIRQEKIQFIGNVNNTQLPLYYSASNMFLQTASSEAGPVTSMEALACTIPVFTTQTGFVYEVLEQHNKGIRVDIKNYSKWKQKLLEYFMGKTPAILDRHIAEKHFSWKTTAQRLVEVYNSVIE